MISTDALKDALPIMSVVIPCYNCQATIAETLDSVFAQSLHGIEIIAVDDGSSDTTLAILEGYKPRIRVVTGPNGGASKARNRGTVLARGTYIQYLDADDILTVGALASRIHALESTGADIAYCDYQYFESDLAGQRTFGKVVARNSADVNSDPEIAVATTFWAPPAALLYRRKIVDAVGRWNETMPMIEDARFLFDAIRAGGQLVRVPGVSAFYRVTPGSLSRSDKPEYVRCVYRNGCDIQQMWESDGELAPQRREALAWVFRGAAFEFLKLDAPEFDDALARYQSLSGDRRGFLALAKTLSPILGRKNALSLLQGAAAARSRLSRKSVMADHATASTPA